MSIAHRFALLFLGKIGPPALIHKALVAPELVAFLQYQHVLQQGRRRRFQRGVVRAKDEVAKRVHAPAAVPVLRVCHPTLR